MVAQWPSCGGRDPGGEFAEVRSLPAEQQGLRDALRNAYRALPRDLPDELRRLLARLR
jgi:hypothetical protein